MVDQHDRDGRTDRSWWTEALDPAENLRALTDVQGFARRTAEDLANRLLGEGNGHRTGHDGSDSVDVRDVAAAELIRRFRADAVRAGEVSASLIDNVVALMTILVDRLPAQPDPHADQILLTVKTGAETSALFWVHNTSAAPVAAVRPHCALPRSHAGSELPAGALRFDPPILDPLPGRSSCGIEVALAVPADTKSGTYVSVIMVNNLPDLYLPLRITVEPAEVTW